MMLSETQREQLERAGALSLSWIRTANLLAVEDRLQFKKDFHNEDSEIYKIYQYGYEVSKLRQAEALLKDAENGKTWAINKLEEQKKEQEYQLMLKELYEI